jgi:hypothetical protein
MQKATTQMDGCFIDHLTTKKYYEKNIIPVIFIKNAIESIH